MAYKILIAPGHDQIYNEFNYINGSNEEIKTDEAHENLRWCKKLFEKLDKQPGIEVKMTRWNDVVRQDMDAKMVISEGYDLYLAPHSNASSGEGAMMLCDVNPDYNDTVLAKAIIDAHCEANGIKNRGLFFVTDPWQNLGKPTKDRTNYYYELRKNEAKVPLIFERFAHDVKGDRDKSLSDSAIESSTTAVARAIISLKGIETNTPPKLPSAPVTSPKVDPVDWLGKYLGTKGIEIQDRAFGKGNRDDYCAAGTSIALMESGVKLPKIYTWVDDLRGWFMRQDLYRTRESGYKPKKKDTIFFDWYLSETGGRNGVGNHVGLVKSSDSIYVYTREPNAGNGGLVADRSFKLSDSDIMGYGVYQEATEDDKQVTIPAIKGYSSVDNLKTGKTPVDLKEGIYFVFKEYEGYLNVSKTPGIPGAWIELKKQEVKLDKPMGITTSEEVKGYTSVDDLKAGKNPVVIMPGSYTIHKTYGEYVNITKPTNPDTPGAWIKLKGVK